jgi:hypothetical protein
MDTLAILSRAAAVSLAAAVLAGCGGGGLTASKRSVRDPVAPPPPGPAVVSAVPPNTPPTQSFKVALTAVAPSRARASGSVTIEIYRKLGEVCWTFERLVGVRHPVGAEIDYDPVSPRAILPLGSAYTSSGCIRGGGNVAVALAEIPPVTNPVDTSFLVAVHATRGKAVVTVLSGAL